VTTAAATAAEDVVGHLADVAWYLDQIYIEDEIDASANDAYLDLTRESLAHLVVSLEELLTGDDLPPSIALRLRGLRSQL
jgi:hypothetical protein